MGDNKNKGTDSNNNEGLTLIRGQESNPEISRELTENGDEIIDFVKRVLEEKEGIEAKKIEDLGEVDKYALEIKNAKTNKIEVSAEIKDEIRDFIAYYEDYVYEGLINGLYDLIDGKINMELLGYLQIYQVENVEIYNELLEIMKKIDEDKESK